MRVVNVNQVPKRLYTGHLMTGPDVKIQFLGADDEDFKVEIVHFGKGVRNKFHAHDSEQLLIVTSGKGIVVTEREKKTVTMGDIIFIPAGEKHWHGATNESEFSHLYVTRAGSKHTQLED